MDHPPYFCPSLSFLLVALALMASSKVTFLCWVYRSDGSVSCLGQFILWKRLLFAGASFLSVVLISYERFYSLLSSKMLHLVLLEVCTRTVLTQDFVSRKVWKFTASCMCFLLLGEEYTLVIILLIISYDAGQNSSPTGRM